jgi:hypothetical protein
VTSPAVQMVGAVEEWLVVYDQLEWQSAYSLAPPSVPEVVAMGGGALNSCVLALVCEEWAQ